MEDVDDGLRSLVEKVESIRLILPERYPKSWSDILHGHLRKHVYVGELLNFALLVSFPENNGEPSTDVVAELWKSLQYAASAGYSSPDSSACASSPVPLNLCQRSLSVEAEMKDFTSSTTPAPKFKDMDRSLSESHVEQKDEHMRCLSFASVAVKNFGKAANSRTFSKKVRLVRQE